MTESNDVKQDQEQEHNCIKPHEILAIQQMILVIRATAMLLFKDQQQSTRMKNWAQIAEDFLERVRP